LLFAIKHSTGEKRSFSVGFWMQEWLGLVLKMPDSPFGKEIHLVSKYRCGPPDVLCPPLFQPSYWPLVNPLHDWRLRLHMRLEQTDTCCTTAIIRTYWSITSSLFFNLLWGRYPMPIP
jgi:hypothetical protein